MNDPILYELPRLSDLDVKFSLDDNGAAVVMTGWTVTAVDVQPSQLAASVAVAISNPATGEVNVTCPWSTLWPLGTGAAVHIRFRLSGFKEALPELVVVLK